MVTTRPPKTIVKPTALGPVANTDTKLLIYGLFQKGRVLAQDGMFLAAASVQRDDLARRLEPHNIEPLVVASGAALRRHGLPERAFWAVSDLISTLGDDPSAAATEADLAREKWTG